MPVLQEHGGVSARRAVDAVQRAALQQQRAQRLHHGQEDARRGTLHHFRNMAEFQHAVDDFTIRCPDAVCPV